MDLFRVWKEEEIDKVWVFVEDYIQKSLDRSGGYADHQDIKDRIKKNLMQLWIAWEEEDRKVYAVGVTEITQYPKYKTLNFRILTGENMEKWTHLIQPIESWAKGEGVTKMEFYMAFGKFTNDYNVRARASSLSSTDEGLRKFMLKVYGYMSVGLGITGVIAWLFANAFVAQNPIVVSLMQPPMAYLVMFAPLGIILWMSFGINKMSAGMAQNLFWVLAACYGVSLASIFLVYTGATIARVFFIAASMFLTMSIWGYTTKRSLAKMGSFLMMGLIGLIIASIVNIFLGSSALQFAMSIIGVIIFAGLTAYDTQVIKEIYVENENSEDSSKKAVMGALKLYLDLLLLFQYLLMLFGNRE